MDRYLPIETPPMEKNRGRLKNKRRKKRMNKDLNIMTHNFQEKVYILHALYVSNKCTTKPIA